MSFTECDEYESASLFTDPRSRHPHVMVIDNYNEMFFGYCLGALISEDYVLVGGICPTISVEHLNAIRIYKAKIIGEEYSNTKHFSIKRFIPFPEPETDIMTLLQLNETISYRIVTSIFRPACLWIETIIPSHFTYTYFGLPATLDEVFYKNESAIYLIAPENIIGYELCAEIIKSQIGFENSSTSFVCFNITSGSKPFYAGSPLQIRYQNRNYVAGAVLGDFPPKTRVAYKISCISWIELNVWPTQHCGQRKINHRPLITHGLTTYHGKYPWHVALYRLQGGRQNCHTYICGGTILNSRTIVTAAHCLDYDYGRLPANRLMVVAGIHLLSQYTRDTQMFFVQNITIHPEYTREYLKYDIALVKLIRQIQFSDYIQAICFDYGSDYINMTIGTVVGWGSDGKNQSSDALLQAKLPVRTNDQCHESNPLFYQKYLNDNNYCAGYGNGTSNCYGDSGGGMVFEHNSRWYIRRIVSSIPAVLIDAGYCDITQFVVFTDVPKLYQWIVRTLDFT